MLNAELVMLNVEFSFGQFGLAFPAVLPLSLLFPGGRGQSEKQERPWHCAHTTQQTPAALSALLWSQASNTAPQPLLQENQLHPGQIQHTQQAAGSFTVKLQLCN